MTLLLAFLGAVFLSNALPHLAAGLRGEDFPTPFARPHGVGMSSPLVNFLWGSANLLAGLLLGSAAGVRVALNPVFAAAIVGFLLMGAFSSIHFGRVRRGKAK